MIPSRTMFMIVDKEHRRIVEDDIETLDQAKKRLAELLEDDPDAEGVLVIFGSVDV